jgi:hypothetical protein
MLYMPSAAAPSRTQDSLELQRKRCKCEETASPEFYFLDGASFDIDPFDVYDLSVENIRSRPD